MLVTGGGGFIGSHLVEALLARGDAVTVLDRFDDSYDPAPRRARVPAAARLVEGDLFDEARLAEALTGVDAVAHLAARPGVRESLRDPVPTVRENVLGTTVVLDAMRRRGLRRLVFASSSSVYGVAPGRSLSEADPCTHQASPYGASKRAAELLCLTAAEAWGLDVSVARLFTVYGPRQRPGMAIARFVEALSAGRPLTLYGDGSSRRDYTFVGDAVAGLLAALDQAEGYRVVNLAGGVSVRLTELAEAVATALGRPLRVQWLPDQAGDVPETAADLTVARTWLGWAPRVGLAEGLRAYLDWRAA